MKLVELHVHYGGSGQKPQGHAISRSYVGVGGVLECLPSTTGADNHCPAGESFLVPADTVKRFNRRNRTFLNHQACGQGVFEHFNVRPSHLLGQGLLYVLAGGISSSVEDARQAVGTFPTQSDLAVAGVEGNPPLNQLGHPLRAFIGQDLHRRRVAKTGPGRQGVLHVQRRGIARSHRCGYAALGVPGVAVVNPALGHNQYGTVLPGQQSSVQTSDAAADNYVIVVRAFHHFSVGENCLSQALIDP